MMTNTHNALKARTHIKNYFILDVEHIGSNYITYRAEDMKHNRGVWLREYFPDSIAKRFTKSDEHSTVYAHPTQSELFHSGKTEFQHLFTNLKLVNHPSIPTVYELFESSGTLYASTKYSTNKETLRYHLNKSTKIFLEQQVGMLALSIIRAFVLLQQRGLQMCFLNPDTLLIDNITQEPIVAYAEYKTFDERSTQSSIEELGRLLYEIMDKENFKESEPLVELKPNRVYSAALCGLVNRMISDESSKHFKTFQELQTLLQSYEATALECEPIVCKRVESKLSSYLSLASVIFVIFFIYYIFTQSSMEVKNLTWFDSMRYHLIAYSGSVKGENALGVMYEKGYYVDADINEAILWYKKAAKQGDEDAQLSLANIYKNVASVKDDKAALEIYTQLAKAGNLYAQKTVAYSYMQGEGASKDYKEAMYWFLKAQEQGDANSCGAIGWMYASGNGVEKDLNKALTWLKKGIDRNDTYSKEQYANVEQAIKKLAEITLQKKSIEEYRLGYQYETGNGRSKNHKQAVEHYITSQKLGNENAEFRLAQLYERSEQLLPRDYSSALYWYKKSAEHGEALAYYRVSKMYRAGHGVKKDEKVALEWCRQAAERGVGVAQGIMGACYEFGWGTHVSYYQAREWYKRAIESGYENAIGRLEKLNKKIRSENEVAKQPQQTNNFNSSVVNSRACMACHGKYFEKSALGKSVIVANMSSSQIATALRGYKYGTYGGVMKGLMRGQVARYSDNALEAFSRTIGR